jgi:hypothetical protein
MFQRLAASILRSDEKVPYLKYTDTLSCNLKAERRWGGDSQPLK